MNMDEYDIDITDKESAPNNNLQKKITNWMLITGPYNMHLISCICQN